MADFLTDEQLTEPKPNTIGGVLHAFGNEMQERLRAELKGSDSYVSGDLAEQIDFNVKMFGGTVKFTLVLQDYYDFVNKGVNGTRTAKNNTPYSYKESSKVPFGYAKKWMNNKGLFATPGTTLSSLASGKTFKAGSKDSQAYVMAKYWKEKGTKGNHFYDKVVTKDRLDKLRVDLERVAANGISVITSNIAKSIFIKK